MIGAAGMVLGALITAVVPSLFATDPDTTPAPVEEISAPDLTVQVLSVAPLSGEFDRVNLIETEHFPERNGMLCAYSPVPGSPEAIYTKGVVILLALKHPGNRENSLVVHRLSAVVDRFVALDDTRFRAPSPDCREREIYTHLVKPPEARILLSGSGQYRTVWDRPFGPAIREMRPDDLWSRFGDPELTYDSQIWDELGMAVNGDNALGPSVVVQLAPVSIVDTQVLTLRVLASSPGYYELHLEVSFAGDVDDPVSTLEFGGYRLLFDPSS